MRTAAPPKPPQCRSLHKTTLHREQQVIYLRCQKGEDHESPKHRGWMKTWDDSEEDGWFEDDYEDDLP